MIRGHGKSTSSRFQEWAANFSEGLFVMLKVYADETGTHDGAAVVALSGLIETPLYWDSFNRRWKGVLDKAKAKYFHYREFRESANTKPGKPYYGWRIGKRRKFIFRLAMLVGDSAVPTGGAYAIERNKKLGINKNPFEQTIRAFYLSTTSMLDKHWPEYDGKVLFIFDDCDKREWTGPLHEIHKEFQDKDSRIGGMAFEDDKDPLHLGLQAADLSAIHWRNTVVDYVKANQDIYDVDLGIIGFLISKNIDPKLRSLPKGETKNIIDYMMKDEALQRRRGFTGTYDPLKHFNFEKYGYPKKI